MSKVTWLLDEPITLMNGDTLDIPSDDEHYGDTKPYWINRADGTRTQGTMRRAPASATGER